MSHIYQTIVPIIVTNSFSGISKICKNHFKKMYNLYTSLKNIIILAGLHLKRWTTDEQLDVVYTDFQNNFDQIDHQFLLNKLNYKRCRSLNSFVLKSNALKRYQNVFYKNHFVYFWFLFSKCFKVLI